MRNTQYAQMFSAICRVAAILGEHAVRPHRGETSRFHFHNRTLRESDLPVVLCPTVLDGSSETQPSYCFGDLRGLLHVGVSAPAGVTDRNMVNVVSGAFGCSDAPEGDHFPSLQLKASYLIERAPDGRANGPAAPYRSATTARTRSSSSARSRL